MKSERWARPSIEVLLWCNLRYGGGCEFYGAGSDSAVSKPFLWWLSRLLSAAARP